MKQMKKFRFRKRRRRGVARFFPQKEITPEPLTMLTKHSISIRGHKTSYSLEDEFYTELKRIAKQQDIPAGPPNHQTRFRAPARDQFVVGVEVVCVAGCEGATIKPPRQNFPTRAFAPLCRNLSSAYCHQPKRHCHCRISCGKRVRLL